jgi:osmoprotectant transport system permease protein
MSVTPRNRVLFVLIVGAMAACLLTGFVSEAPNRLISGHALALLRVSPPLTMLAIIGLGVALFLLAFSPETRKTQGATIVIAGVLLLLIIFDAGRVASILMKGAPPATRIGLGPGFWVALFCLSMITIDALQRLRSGTVVRFTALALIVAPIAIMLSLGTFNQLSLLREYASRRDVFTMELIRHGVLVLASSSVALLIGMPLGLLVARKPTTSGAVFSTLNLLQTIPSVALFGILIVPLSALAAAFPTLGAIGIGGIGPAPAILALILYALLPVARNTQAGITGVDPAVIDAAKGIGFTPSQIFWRVELPLGLPTFLAGFRIMLVQTIGLAVVAALIGAGGLGTFVFQGIGQYATDLVLLGAIPAILLALAADFLVTLATAALTERPTP